MSEPWRRVPKVKFKLSLSFDMNAFSKKVPKMR